MRSSISRTGPHPLDVVAGDRRHRDWRWRLFFPRGLGVGYDNIAELLRGNAPVALLLGLVARKVADVGLLAEFGNFGRRAGAAADDWRSDRRIRGASRAVAGPDAGTVGADGDGRDARRRAGRAADGDAFLA